MTTEFQGFPKIPRWSRDIIISEKIDGTNACVVIEEPTSETDGWIRAQSRARFITPESDNYGFAAWVKEHAEELKTLGPGRHFGEWWGRGINRNYGQTERHFSLFNVSRWDEATFNRLESAKFRKPGAESISFLAPPACCQVVPVLYHGPLSETAIEEQLDSLVVDGSAAVEGWVKPEGIVIFHTAGGYLFKKTIENDERAKGAQ